MTTNTGARARYAMAAPAVIFTVSWLITHTPFYQSSPGKFTLPLLLDLTFTAPLAYVLVARKNTASAYAVLRIFMAGLIMGMALIARTDRSLAIGLKTWVAPLVEALLIGFIIWRFQRAGKAVRKSGIPDDFLFQCRQILTPVLGNARASHILSSEIAVFYYAFAPLRQKADQKASFSNHRKNGIILVLSAFLGIFIVETLGMHFLLSAWSLTAAWVVTVLSMYTCLQLFAHLRAMVMRPVMFTEDGLVIRHGLMGGDVVIDWGNIQSVCASSKEPAGKHHLKVALIRGMEKHSVDLQTKEPVNVIRAFGIWKTTSHLLLCIDKPIPFIQGVREKITN